MHRGDLSHCWFVQIVYIGDDQLMANMMKNDTFIFFNNLSYYHYS